MSDNRTDAQKQNDANHQVPVNETPEQCKAREAREAAERAKGQNPNAPQTPNRY